MTSHTFFAAPRLDGAVVFLVVVVGFTLLAKPFLRGAAVFLAGGDTTVFLAVVAFDGLEFYRGIKTRYGYK
jgi:hypothetical protein